MNIEQFTEKAREAIADASALAQQTPPLPPRVGASDFGIGFAEVAYACGCQVFH